MVDSKTAKREIPPAPWHADGVPNRDATEGPRNILLFSDGTGNSSAKAQKTNVWRLYEAIDLGYPVSDGQPVQLAYYDNGVGTSAFRLFAMLGGVFGFGLARNIRDIYKFLCRNYREGDRIYAFGFSRGAYTIRLLVALIAAMGVSKYRTEPKSEGERPTLRTERELDEDARDMWREFRRSFHTNNRLTDLLVAMGRATLRTFVRATRRLVSRRAYAECVPAVRRRPWWLKEWYQHWWPDQTAAAAPECGPEIEFVGVWDTVAAYGGPLVEITRAVDEWIWPLTMPDYKLSAKVKAARHALAIDDKRDAFQPLLWDEVQEQERIARGELPGQDPKSPRLQQVWFAGMHSDVGGGYDDESLSYVSLWWMIEHAVKARVRLLPEFEQRIESFRNVYGPLHDSRGGAGAFYRYQPRYINAWIDFDGSVQKATQIFRDPTIDRGRYCTRGMLLPPIRLHVSVEERLRMATDGYAPNNLPKDYCVDDGIRGLSAPHASGSPDPQRIATLGDRIKLRRFWYFTTMVLALLLAIKPWWRDFPVLRYFSGEVDVRTDAHVVEAAIDAVLPAFLTTWTHTFAATLFSTLALVLLIGLTTALGISQERAMIDVSRGMWSRRLKDEEFPLQPLGRFKAATHRIARIVRTSDRLQGFFAWVKWRAMPVSVGFVLWLGLTYVVAAGITQVWLARAESRPPACPAASGNGAKTVHSAAAICVDTGATVTPGTTYRIEIYPVETRQVRDRATACGVAPDTPLVWFDACRPATPAGWDSPPEEAAEQTLAQRLGLWLRHDLSRFFRRVTSAPLMAPIVEIRSDAEGPLELWTFGDSVYMLRPEFEQVTTNDGVAWAGTFTAPAEQLELYGDTQQARLHMFLNDAVLPFDQAARGARCALTLNLGFDVLNLCGRYRNNAGAYTVRVSELPPRRIEEVIDERIALDKVKAKPVDERAGAKPAT